MDVYILISALSVLHVWSSCTVLSAPSAETPAAAQGRHVRTKRCSCATFLDKECVYFCHLDIIWVNTPERVVSYGLGDAPRARRAVRDSMATGGAPRCQCLRERDVPCGTFCRTDTRHRYETSPAAVIRSAEGRGCVDAQCNKQQLAADTGRVQRVENSNKTGVSPLATGAALKTRLLLEKRRARQRHRARAWEGESTAS